MRIEDVQSNQPGFGTKVYATKETKRAISRLGKKKDIYNQVKELNKNDKDDILLLSATRARDNKKECLINVDLIKEQNEGDGYLTNPFFECEKLTEKQADGTNRYIDLKRLYSVIKEDLIPISLDKVSFKNLLSKYKEL